MERRNYCFYYGCSTRTPDSKDPRYNAEDLATAMENMRIKAPGPSNAQMADNEVAGNEMAVDEVTAETSAEKKTLVKS